MVIIYKALKIQYFQYYVQYTVFIIFPNRPVIKNTLDLCFVLKLWQYFHILMHKGNNETSRCTVSDTSLCYIGKHHRQNFKYQIWNTENVWVTLPFQHQWQKSLMDRLFIKLRWWGGSGVICVCVCVCVCVHCSVLRGYIARMLELR